jgi:hypothetical protein
MTSSNCYGSFYDPRFRNSYMSHEAWAVTGPIFETQLSRRPYPAGKADLHAISPAQVVSTGVALTHPNAASLFSFPRFSAFPKRLAVPDGRETN